MDMPEPIFRFAEALRRLLSQRTPTALDLEWERVQLERVGWDALERAWRRDRDHWEAALDEVDGLLLRLLDRLPVVSSGFSAAALHLRTFRAPAAERLQHAAAAALVAQRFGAAGLRTVVEDERAPFVRRYFAFFALAERHPPSEWPLFRRHLTPRAHHALLGAAVEAARYYPAQDPAPRLVQLFERIRGDLHLREFLAPRLLETLFVLEEPSTLPFFRELLTTGHTHAEPEHCEVTRALVMVKRFTGVIEPNVKFPDSTGSDVETALAEAEAAFGAKRDVLHPVVVI
jgi:hypothetical protein